LVISNFLKGGGWSRHILLFVNTKIKIKTQNSKYLFHMSETKMCNICQQVKEVSQFHKWKHGPDGLKRECKECRKKETKSYYQKNSESIKSKVSDYRKNNPDKVKEVKKRIYERNKETILQTNQQYKTKNRKKITSRNLGRRKSDPIHNLKHVMNSRLRIFLKSKNISKKNRTFEVVGCTPMELKEHLESKFINGMSWDNQGDWHIDHIIPLSSANNEEEIYKLCRYSNLQPLWAIDNIKKGNKKPPQ
jgi:transketolase